MSTVYLFGAGASYSYDASPTGVRPPLANGFFQAYANLQIAEDFDVKVGSIVTHVRDTYGIPLEEFGAFDQDIEQFMTHLDIQLRYLSRMMAQRGVQVAADTFGNFIQINQAFDQTTFLTAHILNDIQNGPTALTYSEFVSRCDPTDTLVTFNWDTLLDRALADSGSWNPDTDYGVVFEAILDGEWRAPAQSSVERKLLKLHGSTNWLVHYVTRHLTTGERGMVSRRGLPPGRMGWALDWNFQRENDRLVVDPQIRREDRGLIPVPQPPDPDSQAVCVVDSSREVATYDDRWRAGYEPFSYFFPPDHPRSGIPLMPLVVPPTSFKTYEEFAHILDPLWSAADSAIFRADKIVIIGYLFPATDTRALDLLRGHARRPNRCLWR